MSMNEYQSGVRASRSGEKATELLTFRVTPKLADRIEKISAAEDCSRAWLVRRLLVSGLKAEGLLEA